MMPQSTSCTQPVRRGLNFKLTMGNIITLTPPLTISQDEMDKALANLDECFKDMGQQTR